MRLFVAGIQTRIIPRVSNAKRMHASSFYRLNPATNTPLICVHICVFSDFPEDGTYPVDLRRPEYRVTFNERPRTVVHRTLPRYPRFPKFFRRNWWEKEQEQNEGGDQESSGDIPDDIKGTTGLETYFVQNGANAPLRRRHVIGLVLRQGPGGQRGYWYTRVHKRDTRQQDGEDAEQTGDDEAARGEATQHDKGSETLPEPSDRHIRHSRRRFREKYRSGWGGGYG